MYLIYKEDKRKFITGKTKMCISEEGVNKITNLALGF